MTGQFGAADPPPTMKLENVENAIKSPWVICSRYMASLEEIIGEIWGEIFRIIGGHILSAVDGASELALAGP